MRFSRGKTTTIAIALFLMFAMAFSLVALPTANAQETRVTYAYMGVMPNPAGVGQEVLLHYGITHPTNWPQAGWEGFTVTVTRPDGTTETLGPLTTDPTGGAGTLYVPTIVGNYTFQSHFPEQVIQTTAYGTPAGTTMLASDSRKAVLVVQEEPIEYYPGSPLPTEYWSRPISGQHREWNTIAGNWLTYVRGTDASPPSCTTNPYNAGPETGHILWAKPLELGGLAGGMEAGPHAYDHGDAYEGRARPTIIIGGILFTNRYQSDGGTRVEQDVVALDLRTGEEQWCKPLVDPDGVSRRLEFGQVYYFDSFNQHSVYAYLWATVGSTWHAFDPFTGRWVYSMSDVPSGNNIYGPDGIIFRHTVDLRNGWISQWNSSRVVDEHRRKDLGARYATDPARGSWIRQYIGLTLDASLGIDWNVSIAGRLGERSAPGSVRKVREGVILGSDFARGNIAPDPAHIWAISTKPGQEGTLLFNVTWDVPFANVHMSIEDASVEDSVFNIAVQETQQQFVFSLDTGKLLWGPGEPQNYQDQYGYASGNRWDAIYDGKLYAGSWGGTLFCYDVQTGKRLWTYDNIDPYSDILWGNNWPIRISFITDGKIYLEHHEHSPIDPLPRGAPFVCLNATTGEEIFKVNLRSTEWGQSAAIADGIIAIFNTYDNRIVAIGKGPSATTVTAPDTFQPLGTPVLIKGSVTDISAGTADYAVTARFPHGVPAVADESIGEWMKYVYLQFARPADAVGVEVVVEVLDPNNNYYEVGRTTTDASGFFSCAFTPEVPGEYTIIATFAGSGAYWPSFAETAIGVEEAPASTPAPTPTPASIADMYFLPVSIGMIVAIIIVLALLVLILLRKR